MSDARIVHDINASEDTFWKVFFDKEYNEELFLKALAFDSWKLVSLDETADRIERVVDAIPKVGDLPGPLKKLVENGVGYRERATFTRADKRMKMVVEPTVMADKLSVSGVVHTERTGDNSCRRIYDAVVNAKVFGIGGMIENRILADIKQSYDKAAEFTNRWIKEKGL
ncbi:MAG TPA: DUF2505 domain-containing protein [Polyangiaceae bacterium]|jgi:hypothetical protein|nr:DUF2505 domain-containing protein [Polyangiaceae bacterium]